jgi:hypothetical protein
MKTLIDRQQKILIIHFLMLFTFIFNLYATVIITEIMPNPASIGEWIEIYNSSSEDLSIANWQIIDRAGNSGKRRQPSIYIRSHTYIILAPDSSTIAKLNLIPTIVAIVMENWAGMNNDGDDLILRNSIGKDIDKMAYDSNAASIKGRSWERINLTPPGYNNINWGQCASEIGHTAGNLTVFMFQIRHKK